MPYYRLLIITVFISDRAPSDYVAIGALTEMFESRLNQLSALQAEMKAVLNSSKYIPPCKLII